MTRGKHSVAVDLVGVTKIDSVTPEPTDREIINGRTTLLQFVVGEGESISIDTGRRKYRVTINPQPNAQLMNQGGTDEWKSAVHEALIANASLTEANQGDPVRAVSDLVGIETRMALDPKVSDAARKLEGEAPKLREALRAVLDLDWEHYLMDSTDKVPERVHAARRVLANAEAILGEAEGNP